MSSKPTPDTLLAAIHRHCLECSGGSRREASRCRMKNCALYPWRVPEATEKAKKDKRQVTMFELVRGGQQIENTG